MFPFEPPPKESENMWLEMFWKMASLKILQITVVIGTCELRVVEFLSGQIFIHAASE